MTFNRSAPYDDESGADGSAADGARAPAWALEHLEVLRDLRDMGMQLARNLTRQVVAQSEARAAADEARAEAGEVACEPPRRAAPIDPALSFSRISRAVRLTLALEARTHRAIEDAGRASAKAGAANDDEDDDRSVASDGSIDYAGISRQIQARVNGPEDYHVRRAVEETIEAAFDDPDDQERLKEELTERLEEDEAFSDRFTWPIGETIALICQDLGLEPDWDRWETRPWARQEAEESPPNSPYATIAQPPDPRCRTGTQRYRHARGLPPLEAPPVLRPGLAARGPP